MKKVLILAIVLYLCGGIWFYVVVLKNPNTMVNICAQSTINNEPASDKCEPQKYTLEEEMMGAFTGITLWLPMIIGTGLRGD